MINKSSLLRINLPIVLLLLTGLCSLGKLSGQVQMYNKPLTLPAYGVREPEIMPDWGEYHYPYTMLDRLTNIKGSRTYNAIYLENEYVKAVVLPEIGGRLHEAQDKTNGYEFLYNQTTIKPALIGLTGAWISGGIEWNFPIGHRQTGFRDTDWKLVSNPDSSKTAWVGEIDKSTGMRWSVGITVHPDRNWVETKVRLYNCTPFIQRFQYWATSAVRATPDYQAVIPGEIMTGHGKHEFYHWPVNNGVNISYWKNTPQAASYFAVNSKSDYFGGYSPEEKGGMVHVADHQIVRGKKLWTWGTAPAGRLWEKLLTDGDLPYFEPQAGAYSDNQPSLFWIMPGETKIFSHFWFPVRDIGVFDYANLEGTLKLDIKDGKVLFGWSPTGKNKNAEIVLTYDKNEFFRKKVDTDPGHPYIGETALPSQGNLYNITMDVLSSAGDTLLVYKHEKTLNPPLLKPLPPPVPPESMTSQDELFVTGDALNRYDEIKHAKEYYNEAIKRDSSDVRCNTALGIMALKYGLFNQANKYFDRAIQRDETSYEALYYKGLTQCYMGDVIGAKNSLNRASYSQTFYAPSHLELSQINAGKGQFQKALDHIERSIRSNGDNTGTMDVEALIYYKLNNYDEAIRLSKTVLITDPLDHFAQAILYLSDYKIKPDDTQTGLQYKRLMELTRADNDNHIELAIRFARSGCYQEALQVLEFLTEDDKGKAVSPLVYYYIGYYHTLTGDNKGAAESYSKASLADPEYCFPYRLEDMEVLEHGILNNSNDTQALYLTGNFLFSHSRPDEAIDHWEKAVALSTSNAVAFRNLGFAYAGKGELLKAKTAYLSALKADPSAGKVIVELGSLNNKMKIPYSEQIDLFEKNSRIVSVYNQAAAQLVGLYVTSGRYQDALKWLTSVHFNSWEGQYGIHQFWEQSNIKQGDLEFEKGHYEKALVYYRQSLTYPDNLEVAEQPNTIHARNNYKIGMALLKTGKKTEALDYFKQAIADTVNEGNALQYYRGKALDAIGEKEKALAVYSGMLSSLDNIKTEGSNDHEKAVTVFCRALALEGLGKAKEAAEQYKSAVELYPLVEISAFRPPRSDL
jgi:tetratricopeptide (TPR) repeat protein